MRATLRIPTKEQYAYIEVQWEGPQDEIVNKYNEITALVHGEKHGPGIEPDEFRGVLDQLVGSGTISGDPGMVEDMSRDQKLIIQEVKKSLKRLNK